MSQLKAYLVTFTVTTRIVAEPIYKEGEAEDISEEAAQEAFEKCRRMLMDRELEMGDCWAGCVEDTSIPYGESPDDIPKATRFDPELVKRIARAASAIFRTWLSPLQMELVLKKGADPDQWCDSNMPIAYAIYSILHIPCAFSPDHGDDDYDEKWKRFEYETELFNAVVSEIQRSEYEAEEDPIWVQSGAEVPMLLHQFIGELFSNDNPKEYISKEQANELVSAQYGDYVMIGDLRVQRLGGKQSS